MTPRLITLVGFAMAACASSTATPSTVTGHSLTITINGKQTTETISRASCIPVHVDVNRLLRVEASGAATWDFGGKLWYSSLPISAGRHFVVTPVSVPSATPPSAGDVELGLSSRDPSRVPYAYPVVSGSVDVGPEMNGRVDWAIDVDLGATDAGSPVIGHVSGTFTCTFEDGTPSATLASP